jgi:hypothetical protein
VREPSLLAGLLFDVTGERLSPSHAVKSGRRYRYYISRGLITEAGSDHGRGWRLPAHDIEQAVIGATARALGDRSALIEGVDLSEASADQIKSLLDRAGRLAALLEKGTALYPATSAQRIVVSLRFNAATPSILPSAYMVPGVRFDRNLMYQRFTPQASGPLGGRVVSARLSQRQVHHLKLTSLTYPFGSQCLQRTADNPSLPAYKRSTTRRENVMTADPQLHRSFEADDVSAMVRHLFAGPRPVSRRRRRDRARHHGAPCRRPYRRIAGDARQDAARLGRAGRRRVAFLRQF